VTPLPAGVACYAVAASTSPPGGGLRGDGLVPVASALGRHRDRRRALRFGHARRVVVHDTGHLELLSSGEVYARLRDWLA
jgi:hypothetical protein